MLEIGMKAPDFTLEDKDGNKKTTDPVTYKENDDGSIEIGLLKLKKAD